jgi:hypothetical protein
VRKPVSRTEGAANQARAQLKNASKNVTFLEDNFIKYLRLGQQYRIHSRINIQLPGYDQEYQRPVGRFGQLTC